MMPFHKQFHKQSGFLQNYISGCLSVLRGVAALGGAVPALCRAFSVLCGVWRRSVELSQRSAGHSQCSARCGGALQPSHRADGFSVGFPLMEGDLHVIDPYGGTCPDSRG